MRRVIIIHYHLNPGGVTRIIESQIKALKGYKPSLKITVITGHCSDPGYIKSLGADIFVCEKLNYLSPEEADPEAVYRSIRDFLTAHIHVDDIVHVHNLNLGKNPLLTLVVSGFVDKGFKVVNHAHDFAEDREQNRQFLKHIIRDRFDRELTGVLYPDKPNLFHITLNSFDKRRLMALGVNEERSFLLPNPVSLNKVPAVKNNSRLKAEMCTRLHLDPAKKLVTYPVRVIRRKNIGEYVLMTVLFSDKANWLVTQPPKNPAEITPYNRWKEFCTEQGIPLVFEAGVRVDFEDLLLASDFCFTTSIKEGFGMVYLEPWLFFTPVIGRDISQVTEDLKRSGIEFPLLYDGIRVPFENQMVDFPVLSVADQQTFISNVLRDESVRNKVFEENPCLETLLNFNNRSIIENNRSTIIKEFSLLNYAKRLEEIYQKIAG
ncbi:MAG: hypothetical protein PVF73_01305 [Bacteroidales bacterium]|jgi:glycosyltransferase involved in cell wall biosynthesis